MRRFQERLCEEWGGCRIEKARLVVNLLKKRSLNGRKTVRIEAASVFFVFIARSLGGTRRLELVNKQSLIWILPNWVILWFCGNAQIHLLWTCSAGSRGSASHRKEAIRDLSEWR
jgi:hypothetical protein